MSIEKNEKIQLKIHTRTRKKQRKKVNGDDALF